MLAVQACGRHNAWPRLEVLPKRQNPLFAVVVPADGSADLVLLMARVHRQPGVAELSREGFHLREKVLLLLDGPGIGESDVPARRAVRWRAAGNASEALPETN